MAEPLRILVDRREQLPWEFDGFGAEPIAATLPSGDYAVDGAPGFVIERKAPGDLLACIGRQRKRFVAELERLADECAVSAVLVETTFEDLVSGQHRSRINAASVAGSIAAWELRFPTVHWSFQPGRRWAERWAFKLLSRWALDCADAAKVAADFSQPMEVST